MGKKIDSVTGLSYMVIYGNNKDNSTLRPAIKISNRNKYNNQDVYNTYFLPNNSVINIKNKSFIYMGDIIARMPKDHSKIKDITGGLPKVADIFEARKPKESALISEISGIINLGKESKEKKRIVIKSKLCPNIFYEELIPKWRDINYLDGDYVMKGDIISDGNYDPHEILRILGINYLLEHICKEIQNVYKLQGVKINDKHIEIIIKQMLRKVIIINPGSSSYLKGEQVNYLDVIKFNKCKTMKNELIIFKRILMGITKSSLSTESFISAASFQETTKVLTEAAVHNSCDMLKGLKENVIVGRLIPAGTGLYKLK